MRDTFKTRVSDPRVIVQGGTFQDTGLAEASVDMVIVAQAWHWCDPNYDEGAKEIARILKPAGIAFFIWNMEK